MSDARLTNDNPLKGDAFLAKLAELANEYNPDAKPITGDDFAEQIMGQIRNA